MLSLCMMCFFFFAKVVRSIALYFLRKDVKPVKCKPFNSNGFQSKSFCLKVKFSLEKVQLWTLMCQIVYTFLFIHQCWNRASRELMSAETSQCGIPVLDFSCSRLQREYYTATPSNLQFSPQPWVYCRPLIQQMPQSFTDVGGSSWDPFKKIHHSADVQQNRTKPLQSYFLLMATSYPTVTKPGHCVFGNPHSCF